ncbi:hypothetical protein CYMTET_15434, partial [Cymbomonas tetramitiformis]
PTEEELTARSEILTEEEEDPEAENLQLPAGECLEVQLGWWQLPVEYQAKRGRDDMMHTLKDLYLWEMSQPNVNCMKAERKFGRNTSSVVWELFGQGGILTNVLLNGGPIRIETSHLLDHYDLIHFIQDNITGVDAFPANSVFPLEKTEYDLLRRTCKLFVETFYQHGQDFFSQWKPVQGHVMSNLHGGNVLMDYKGTVTLVNHGGAIEVGHLIKSHVTLLSTMWFQHTLLPISISQASTAKDGQELRDWLSGQFLLPLECAEKLLVFCQVEQEKSLHQSHHWKQSENELHTFLKSSVDPIWHEHILYRLTAYEEEQERCFRHAVAMMDSLLMPSWLDQLPEANEEVLSYAKKKTPMQHTLNIAFEMMQQIWQHMDDLTRSASRVAKATGFTVKANDSLLKDLITAVKAPTQANGMDNHALNVWVPLMKECIRACSAPGASVMQRRWALSSAQKIAHRSWECMRLSTLMKKVRPPEFINGLQFAKGQRVTSYTEQGWVTGEVVSTNAVTCQHQFKDGVKAHRVERTTMYHLLPRYAGCDHDMSEPLDPAGAKRLPAVAWPDDLRASLVDIQCKHMDEPPTSDRPDGAYVAVPRSAAAMQKDLAKLISVPASMSSSSQMLELWINETKMGTVSVIARRDAKTEEVNFRLGSSSCTLYPPGASARPTTASQGDWLLIYAGAALGPKAPANVTLRPAIKTSKKSGRAADVKLDHFTWYLYHRGMKLTMWLQTEYTYVDFMILDPASMPAVAKGKKGKKPKGDESDRGGGSQAESTGQPLYIARRCTPFQEQPPNQENPPPPDTLRLAELTHMNHRACPMIDYTVGQEMMVLNNGSWVTLFVTSNPSPENSYQVFASSTRKGNFIQRGDLSLHNHTAMPLRNFYNTFKLYRRLVEHKFCAMTDQIMGGMHDILANLMRIQCIDTQEPKRRWRAKNMSVIAKGMPGMPRATSMQSVVNAMSEKHGLIASDHIMKQFPSAKDREKGLVFPRTYIIHGDPGSGRSTLLKQILLCILCDTKASYIPLYVNCVRIAREIRKGGMEPNSMAHLLHAHIICCFGEGSWICRLLMATLQMRRLVVLVDQLDQVPTKMKADMEKYFLQTLHNEGHTVVVTTRPKCFDAALTNHASVERFELMKLDGPMQKEFIEARFTAMCESILPMQAIQAYSDFTNSPIMLSMLCSVFKKNGKLGGRAETFELAVNAYLKPHAESSIFSVDDMIGLLKRVAHHHHFLELRDITRSSMEALKLDGNAFALWMHLLDATEHGTLSLLSCLRQRYDANDDYSVCFSHLGFQYYFAALQHVDNLNAEPSTQAIVASPYCSELLPPFTNLINMPWWWRVTQFAAEFDPSYHTKLVKCYMPDENGGGGIHLQGPDVSRFGARHLLCKMIQSASNLRRVHVCRPADKNAIDDKVLEAIADALASRNEPGNLVELELSGCLVTNRAATALAEALTPQLPAVIPATGQGEPTRSLSPSQLPVREECHNSTLERLTLKKVELPVGSLRRNEVTTLDFSAKELYSVDAIVLGAMVNLNQSLTNLNLADNALCGVDVSGFGSWTPDGLIMLSRALTPQPPAPFNCIKTLGLKGNHLGGKSTEDDVNVAVHALSQALRTNNSLTRLDLKSNNLGPKVHTSPQSSAPTLPAHAW